MTDSLHMVARADDNGVRVLVRSGMDAAEASALMARLASGHKQMPIHIEYQRGQRDQAMAREDIGLM